MYNPLYRIVAMALLVLVVAMTTATPLLADKGRSGSGGKGSNRHVVAAAVDPLYLKECGSCHMPYAPALLPARSWQQMMAHLDKHFGENAELPVADKNSIQQYLMANSSEQSTAPLAKKILVSIPAAEIPASISTTPYFIREHRKITLQQVRENPNIRSFAACQACHTQANAGSFDEHEVLVPTAAQGKP
ncbi:MAG: hypothetical protein HQL58_03160 [Magnetococcales bacterium]|nr:hypothetical protein [Magnetococcales bacterium]